MEKKQYLNSGVDGSSGYEFQKHCALYIFLEQYKEIKNQKYFICLEHYEDFLFCYLTNDEIIKKIETYQAKKSSKKWTLTKEFKEIIKKILNVGIALKNDPATKIDTYTHNLHFLSNHEINLSKTIKRKKIENIINERKNSIKYNELYQEIKNEILPITDNSNRGETKKLIFKWIDIGKTHKKQTQLLVGMFSDVFGNTVLDHKASVETLLSLFREIENTLNQGNTVALMDKSKRVESEQINNALNIITTQQKAFDEWRSNKSTYSLILKIPVKKQKKFELEFQNAFDYFKDLEQVEHQKINSFVQKVDLSNCYTDKKALEKIVNEFKQQYNTQFDDTTVKAIILASYIQQREEN